MRARLVIGNKQRSRPNEGHLAHQDIVELRQLVQSSEPQQRAEFRDAMLIGNSIALFVVRGTHRAEFVQLERSAVTAGPTLPEHNRQPDIDRYQQRYRSEEWRHDYQEEWRRQTDRRLASDIDTVVSDLTE